MSNAIYNFWLSVGDICKTILIPIFAFAVLFRLYIFIGYKCKLSSRWLKFYDKFVEAMAEEFKNSNNAADVINFKNKNGGAE